MFDLWYNLFHRSFSFIVHNNAYKSGVLVVGQTLASVVEGEGDEAMGGVAVDGADGGGVGIGL